MKFEMKEKINLKGKKIVITGGAGFIGSHIADALLSEDAQVIIVDIKKENQLDSIAHIKDKIEYHNVSIVDTAKLTDIFKGAYAVLHQAALPSVPRSIEFPLETQNINSTGTISVFVAAKDAGVERLVYASSSSVYGNTPVLPKVETMIPDPLSPYAAQKLTNELYGKIFYTIFGLKTIGLRYFNVFGPRQNPDSEYAAVIPKFIKLMKNGHQPTIFGDGENFRDFTHVKNVADANISALKADSGFGEVFNISCGEPISLNCLASQINSILSKTIESNHLPLRKGDIKDSFADINKAKEILGYKPTIYFNDGLNLTVKWFLEGGF